jgi:hypothetical protein
MNTYLGRSKRILVEFVQKVFQLITDNRIILISWKSIK